MNTQEPSLSTAAVDQLGERLRRSLVVEDLRLLDQHRREFRPDYGVVAGAVRQRLGLVPSGRPAKSTAAILDKLRRSSMRLSQMQDIAGCRVVLPDLATQDRTVTQLQGMFPSTVHDRRLKPSHGYRAVHVVVRPNRRPIEVQVRTDLQQLWAELSEKSADAYGIDVKYGGGPEAIRALLATTSELIAEVEELESDPSLAGDLRLLRDEVASRISKFLELVRSQK